jgi:hypothetical protein
LVKDGDTEGAALHLGKLPSMLLAIAVRCPQVSSDLGIGNEFSEEALQMTLCRLVGKVAEGAAFEITGIQYFEIQCVF